MVWLSYYRVYRAGEFWKPKEWSDNAILLMVKPGLFFDLGLPLARYDEYGTPGETGWRQHPTPWFSYIPLGSLGLACMCYAFTASSGVYFSSYGPIMFCNTLPYACSLPERRCWFIRTNNLVLSLYNLDYAT
ncbi:hypothetical protein VNO77_41886 [Canavalia gladiata]|uniref:Uncharacterized protein n=1 Tax=Canavalia gladiata TaxID=3824 RepID=A0AAN9PS78_CANGL